jgi:O-antigen ligase
MNSRKLLFERAAPLLTFGSAVTIIVSIAASQILLGLALAALLLSGERLRLPRIKLALGLFLLLTVISLLFSGDIADGLPQIRKFFVFFELLVVFSCVRDLGLVRWLFLAWAGLATLSAFRGFIQFAAKVREAHMLDRPFYLYYVSSRITGFTSHWNTFSELEMFALLMLAAFLFFSPHARKRAWLWMTCLVIIALAIVLAETRGVYFATAIAGSYLIWFWNRKLILLVPVAIVIAFLASPSVLRERFESIVHGKREDSNTFRIVAWRTGIQMIEAHPLLGLGPDGTKYHFKEYIPADIPRPLPDGFYQHLHNVYLQYAAERGIPALLVFLWFLGQLLLDFWRGVSSLPAEPTDRRFVLHGAIAVILATIIQGFVEVDLGDSHVLAAFLVVVACGYLAIDKLDSHTTA